MLGFSRDLGTQFFLVGDFVNSRERIEMALNFEQPDRTPIFASFVPEIEEKIREKSYQYKQARQP